MSTSAIVMMVLICGLIWGGFVSILLKALSNEKRKQSEGVTPSAAGSR